MPISIYPPTLQSTQPAFLSSTDSYNIQFTLQPVTSFSEIGHIQIRVVTQKNNSSIVNTDIYPDGIIYKAPKDITSIGDPYSIAILSTDLAQPWQPGYLYKVQLRFGENPIFENKAEFAAWKKLQVDTEAFSEWSTVMVIKAITQPEVIIQNADAVKESVIATSRTEPTTAPLFVGITNIQEINKELVDKYRFTLYYGDEVDGFEKLETSGWLQHNSSVNNTDEHRFKTLLDNGETYTVTYEIETINGYTQTAEPYTFLALRSYLAELEGVELQVESDTIYCRENGCINLYLTNNIPLTGSYLVTRSSEKSGYRIWEDLSYFVYSNKTFNNHLFYQDFTVESGVRYKYAFQQENAKGLRTSPLYPQKDIPHSVDFEYSYIYRDGIQLKLKFNHKMNTFKHTVLASKQDTLGDRYPHLVRNGYAYYAEFPITGLISFQMDDDKTFMRLGSEGYLYDGNLAIPRDKFEEQGVSRPACEKDIDTSGLSSGTNYNDLTIDHTLTDNNIYIERRFREKAEEFLNDFEYKLYKSPTEGNIVIGLMNVSLTPNATLGRMIFEFSATAYEVLENTLENLNEVGIINIGGFQSLASDEIHLSFGQISGIYTPPSPQDVYAKIRAKEEVSLGNGYKIRLERIRAIWIEGYPLEDFKEDLLELEALQAELKNKGEDTAEIDKQIEEHMKLQSALSGPSAVTTKLRINSKEILVMPNKVYSLREPVYDLQVTSAISPIIVNYVCETTQQEDQSAGVVSAIDASRIWGQVSGVFTGTDKVLKTYNYNYGPGELPYRVYNRLPDVTVIYDYYGNTLVDNTNFNVYKIVNLYEIIKEETRHQVEFIYAIADGFYQDENGNWTDGTIYYNFADIIELDVEADSGTTMLIGKAIDGSDATEVMIGPTGRYILRPMESLVRYIAFKEPQFALVNYKCLTNQMKVKRGGEA